MQLIMRGGTPQKVEQDWTLQKDAEDLASEHCESQKPLRTLTGKGTSRSAYVDDITGEELPAEACMQTRAEEVKAMQDWGVWEEVPYEQCWKRLGRRPLRGRWVDHNKGIG